MGWLNGMKTVCFEIPKEQYDTLRILMREAKEVNPEFDENTWLAELIGSWISTNWRGTINKMANYGQGSKKRKTQRVARK